LQAQVKRFGELRKQDMQQIEKLTNALIDSQKRLAKASAAAAASQRRRGDKTAESEHSDADGENGSSTLPDAAELRLQLSAAEASISQLRSQLADLKNETRAASTAWKSSAEVEQLLEEQADRCVLWHLNTAAIMTSSPSSSSLSRHYVTGTSDKSKFSQCTNKH
jgi:hypothetical protein